MSTRATHVRVADGAIAEYFITLGMIATRGHPEGWYVPIVYEAMPTVGEFEYAHPTMKLIGNVQPDENGFFKDCHVLVTYHVAKKGLLALLQMAWGNNFRPALGMLPGEETQVPPPVVEAPLMAAIRETVEDEIYKLLDIFAKQKDYRDFKHLSDYKDSNIESWREEALYAIQMRDLVWLDFYKLFDEISANKRPLIKSFAEVKNFLPELVWPVTAEQTAEQPAPVVETAVTEAPTEEATLAPTETPQPSTVAA